MASAVYHGKSWLAESFWGLRFAVPFFLKSQTRKVAGPGISDLNLGEVGTSEKATGG